MALTFLDKKIFPTYGTPNPIQEMIIMRIEDVIAFGKAEVIDTIPAYGQFLKKYKNTAKAGKARQRYDTIIENSGALNLKGLNNDTIQLAKDYLKILPDGRHKKFCREAD